MAATTIISLPTQHFDQQQHITVVFSYSAWSNSGIYLAIIFYQLGKNSPNFYSPIFLPGW